jgi:hypothetical protein
MIDKPVKLRMMMSLMTGFLILILFSVDVVAQQYPFSQKQVVLPQLAYSACAWGDYDHDGDLDLALTGAEGNTPVSRILRNDNGIFTDQGASIQPLHFGSVEWGDYDADGDLDLLITGMDSQGGAYTKIIANTNGSFNDSGILLPGIADGQATWGDCNNDGLTDILLCGNMITSVYRNEGNGLFLNINAPLMAVTSPMCSWCDYNNDGQSDILVCGDTGGGFYSRLYKNQDGTFTEVSVGSEPFMGLYSGQTKWADLDNDGDHDLVISGMDLYIDAYLLVYRNDGNDQFTKFTVPNGNLLSGSIDLGDYDADGLTDIIIMGRTPGCGGNATTILLHNEGAMNFLPVSSLLPGYKQGAVTFGDYNNDGFSDLLFTGLDAYDFPQTDLYLNNLGDTTVADNTAPSTPEGLEAVMENDHVILKWNSAGDQETPTVALSYNLMIGTQPGSSDILAPMANSVTGSRLVAATGNASSDTTWIIKGLNPGIYYFSVQAVDNGFASGSFAEPEMFSYTPVGIEETSMSELMVFPNPCSNFFNISTASRKVVFSVFNSIGKEVLTGETNEQIDCTRWPAGIYLIRFGNSNQAKTVKLIRE